MDPSRGPQSHSAEPNRDQHADSPQQSKSGLGPTLHNLSRCSACYNHNKNAKRRWGGGSESSSSAEDSGPEEEVDSEEESSSSSSSAENLVAETPGTEKESHVLEDDAEPELRGQDVNNGHQETGSTVQNQADEKQAKGGTIRRAPLVKSYSLPASFTPRLIPFSLLPRPPQVISTLHLQVLSQKQDKDTLFSIHHRLSERAGGGSLNQLPLQQMGLPWQHGSQQPTLPQHQLSHQYQQPSSQYFFPQGQRLPPPYPLTLHTHPQGPAHLNAFTPQPSWYCHYMHFFPNTHWSHYSSTQLPR